MALALMNVVAVRVIPLAHQRVLHMVLIVMDVLRLAVVVVRKVVQPHAILGV